MNYMERLLPYLLLFVVLYAVAATLYLGCNKGMARNARGQQLRRLLIASLVGVLPAALDLSRLTTSLFLLPLATGVAWMVTYPLTYHLTYRRSSPDYENYMDITFGLYLTGWLTSLGILVRLLAPGSVVCGVLLTLLYVALWVPPLFQWVWFITYGTCVDANGMKIIQETNVNETIEFFRSFPWWAVAAVVVLTVGTVGLLGYVCLHLDYGATPAVYPRKVVAAAMVLTGFYVWKPRHGVFVRTGIATLYRVVKEYVAGNARYRSSQQQRLSQLHVEPQGQPWTKPTTLIMVIGESACRDFMSAYHPAMAHDTTPWMRREATDDPGFVLFPHAYSCAMQTVPALERALTERNQYNDKPFISSCSIIDMAHRMGYHVHWYSNQGHLGAAETPVTLVADTADVAKWTRQEVNRVQYDSSLLDFFSEVDPTQNNFIVFHLKGSHFNFMSRYPREFTRWGKAGVQDNVVNYENSIAYTDSILEKIFTYARQRLNLQAMVYFSDHATEPGRRRKPNFDGFQMTRIPLFVWMGSDYRRCHPARWQALHDNRDKYFTNDLAYELLCGVFDLRSDHFDESASLASAAYRFNRSDLLTYEGRKHISDDDEEDDTNSI